MQGSQILQILQPQYLVFAVFAMQIPSICSIYTSICTSAPVFASVRTANAAPSSTSTKHATLQILSNSCNSSCNSELLQLLLPHGRVIARVIAMRPELLHGHQASEASQASAVEVAGWQRQRGRGQGMRFNVRTLFTQTVLTPLPSAVRMF